jgi:hypothetical protein
MRLRLLVWFADTAPDPVSAICARLVTLPALQLTVHEDVAMNHTLPHLATTAHSQQVQKDVFHECAWYTNSKAGGGQRWPLLQLRRRTNEHGALARLGQCQGLRIGQNDRLCGRVVEVHIVQLAIQHLSNSGPSILQSKLLQQMHFYRQCQYQLQSMPAEATRPVKTAV